MRHDAGGPAPVRRERRRYPWLAAEQHYNLLPIVLQNAFVARHGRRILRERFGPEFDRLSRLLEESERWTREELRAYQESRLRDIVLHAYDTVPYYRDLFDRLRLKPADIRSIEDLAKLPPMTRGDVAANAERLVSSAFDRKTLRFGLTSGTSSSPLKVYWDRSVCLMNNACYMRARRWAGVPLGTRYASISGRSLVPLNQKRPPFWRHNPAWNQVMFSSLHLSETNLVHYVRALREFRVEALEGYPAAAYILARFLEARDEHLQLKAVMTTGEPLYPEERRVIEERFCTKVFDQYAEAERVVFTCECERHDGHHIFEEYGITEFLDDAGAPVPAGTPGRITGTTLYNTAMPLLRYTFGDVGTLSPRTCSCGRPLHLLEGLTTRDEDILVTPDGRLIPPIMVSWAPRIVQGVTDWQLVQNRRDELTARFVVDRPLSGTDREWLATYFKGRLGPDIRVVIEQVDEIPLSSRGKHRRVVSTVPLPWQEPDQSIGGSTRGT
jgi:phenylacetate-CoA ligase